MICAVIFVYVRMKLLFVNVTVGVLMGPSDLSDFKITTQSNHICSLTY